MNKIRRRTRVGKCPSCDKDTPIQPKQRAPKGEVIDGEPFTMCVHCFTVFTNDAVESRLVTIEEYIEGV